MRISDWSSDVCFRSGLPTFCGVVSNAGKASFKGLEFEGRARLGEDIAAVGDRLTLSTALGYTDAQYKEYITNIGGVPTDVADFREVQNTPKWTASANLAYSTPIGDGDLSFGTTLSYRSKRSAEHTTGSECVSTCRSRWSPYH